MSVNGRNCAYKYDQQDTEQRPGSVCQRHSTRIGDPDHLVNVALILLRNSTGLILL